MDRRLESRDVFVGVRLVVDEHWHLLHGELVDVHTHPRGRFLDWPSVIPALRRFLSEEHDAAEGADPRRPDRTGDRQT